MLYDKQELNSTDSDRRLTAKSLERARSGPLFCLFQSIQKTTVCNAKDGWRSDKVIKEKSVANSMLAVYP